MKDLINSYERKIFDPVEYWSYKNQWRSFRRIMKDLLIQAAIATVILTAVYAILI
jgi:hypothetical protein